MTRSFRTATTSLAVAFLLTGLIASAHGFMGLSPWQTGSPGRLIQLRGTVVCTGCTLAEARRLQHDTYGNHLYQVTAPQGQLVLNIRRLVTPAGLMTSPSRSSPARRGGSTAALSAAEPPGQGGRVNAPVSHGSADLDVSAVVIRRSPRLFVSEAQTRQ
jgi:hypothetical protein